MRSVHVGRGLRAWPWPPSAFAAASSRPLAFVGCVFAVGFGSSPSVALRPSRLVLGSRAAGVFFAEPCSES